MDDCNKYKTKRQNLWNGSAQIQAVTATDGCFFTITVGVAKKKRKKKKKKGKTIPLKSLKGMDIFSARSQDTLEVVKHLRAGKTAHVIAKERPDLAAVIEVIELFGEDLAESVASSCQDNEDALREEETPEGEKSEGGDERGKTFKKKDKKEMSANDQSAGIVEVVIQSKGVEEVLRKELGGIDLAEALAAAVRWDVTRRHERMQRELEEEQEAAENGGGTTRKGKFPNHRGMGEAFDELRVREKPDQKVELIPKPFRYQLMPKQVVAEVRSTRRERMLWQTQKKDVLVTVSQGREPEKELSEMERSEVMWFARFLQHCMDEKLKCNLSLPRMLVQEAVERLVKKEVGGDLALQGIEELGEEMRDSFRLFETSKTLPRGVLLYGPPGTGKTTIIKRLCEALNVKLVGPMMAAGDFAKPLVGQSERMINMLAERAERVPWRLCAVVVDEIESLVQSREKAGGGGGSSQLSVLLSRIGGVSDVRNLIFFAATNHPEQMDGAFMRRMHVKLFVGPPTRLGRADFIAALGKDILSPDDPQHSCPGEGKCADAGCLLLRGVVAMMVNFAPAQIMGGLQRIRGVLASSSEVAAQGRASQSSPSPSVAKREEVDRFELVANSLSRFCEQEDILVSSYNQVDVLAPLVRGQDEWHHVVQQAAKLFALVDPRSSSKSASGTGRMVVDLEGRTDQVQVEIATIDPTPLQLEVLQGQVSAPLKTRPTHLDAVTSSLMSVEFLRGTVDLMKRAFADDKVVLPLVDLYGSVLQHMGQMERMRAVLEQRPKPLLRAFKAQFASLFQGQLAPFGEHDMEAVHGEFKSKFQDMLKTLNARRRKAGEALQTTLKIKFGGRQVQSTIAGPHAPPKKEFSYFSLTKPQAGRVEVMRLCFRMAWWSNASRVVLVNRQFFHSHRKVQEGDMKLYLHSQLQMLAENFKTGLLVIDLDSLMNPRQDGLGGTTFENESLFAMLLGAMEEMASVSLWFVVFSKDKRVLRRVRHALKWEARVDRDPLRLCVHCARHVRGSENKVDACGSHSGPLHNFKEAPSSASSLGQSNEPAPVPVRTVGAHDHQGVGETIRQVRAGALSWKCCQWSCCGQPLYQQSGGEIPSRHVFEK
jgi:ATP-dependent 26S proteasome regulatory subunit